MYLKIGSLKINSLYFLAPLTKVTDIAFRLLVRHINPDWKGLMYTEMIDAKQLAVGKKNTEKRAFSELLQESPVALQLFGTNEHFISKSIQKFESQFDLFDFNLGCPTKQAISQGAGVQLLKRPRKIHNIIVAMRKASQKPITVKIRLGIQSPKHVFKTAQLIQDSGADAICVHGRTAFAPYTVPANWEIIHQIREELDIPVIGNGDIFNSEIAYHHLKSKNDADAVMIGRAALHNPKIFSQCMDSKMLKVTDIERWNWIDVYYKLARKYNVLTEQRLRHRISDFLHPILSKNALDYLRDVHNQQLSYKAIFSFLHDQAPNS